MTRDDIRLTNLRKLVQEYRTITALAEEVGTSEKYLSQILSGTLLPSGKPRGVGNALARKLETGTMKDPGWMDLDHDKDSTTANHPEHTPEEAELLRLFRRANPSKRKAMLSVGRIHCDDREKADI